MNDELLICAICADEIKEKDGKFMLIPDKVRKINPYEEIQKLTVEIDVKSDHICKKCYWDLVSISNSRKKMERDVNKLKNFNINGRTGLEETVKVIEERKFEEIKITQGNFTKVLPPQLEMLGKSLLYSRWREVSKAAFDTPVLQISLKENFCKILQKESEGLCNKKDPSILRKTSKDDIKSFNLVKLYKELSMRAPFLVKVLSLIGFNGYQARRDQDLHIPAVCVAAATLLKNRNQQMNAMQVMTNSIVQHSSLTVSN